MPIINSLRQFPGTLTSNIAENHVHDFSRPPVVYYTAEEGTSDGEAISTLTDQMGNANGTGVANGSAVKPTYDTTNPGGHLSYSIYFPGPSSTAAYISADGIVSEVHGSNSSISFWVKFSATSGPPFFWARMDASKVNKTGGGVQIATGRNHIAWFGGSAYTYNVYGNVDIADDDWHHIVMVWIEDNVGPQTVAYGYTIMFVDGLLDYQARSAYRYDLLESDDIFVIGQEFDGSTATNGYIGYMADFSVWDFAVTLEQAVVMYNGGTPHDLRFGIPRWKPGDPPKYHSPWVVGV